jgi:hypothetical protein
MEIPGGARLGDWPNSENVGRSTRKQISRAIGCGPLAGALRGRMAAPEVAATCPLCGDLCPETQAMEWRRPVELSSKSAASRCKSSVRDIAKNSITNTQPSAAHSASGLRRAFWRWPIQRARQSPKMPAATSSQRILRNNSIYVFIKNLLRSRPRGNSADLPAPFANASTFSYPLDASG